MLYVPRVLRRSAWRYLALALVAAVTVVACGPSDPMASATRAAAIGGAHPYTADSAALTSHVASPAVAGGADLQLVDDRAGVAAIGHGGGGDGAERSGRCAHLSRRAGAAVHGARVFEGERTDRAAGGGAQPSRLPDRGRGSRRRGVLREASRQPPGTTGRGCSSWRCRRSHIPRPPRATGRRAPRAARPRPCCGSRNRTMTKSVWDYSVDTL